MTLARLPDPGIIVEVGPFGDYVGQAPQADLHIFGLTARPDFDFVRDVVDRTRSSCLFVRDSGHESVLA